MDAYLALFKKRKIMLFATTKVSAHNTFGIKSYNNLCFLSMAFFFHCRVFFVFSKDVQFLALLHLQQDIQYHVKGECLLFAWQLVFPTLN